ncbi:MAG: AarF/ABC1/UbiB kinase family protein [Polyangiaceae bacterium]|nr:AarF/ABC1/UbiB kinase family protein [Polyangiaceae bacterium]
MSEGVSILGVVVRDLSRLDRVARVVARHGFGELIARTPLGSLVSRVAALPEGDAELSKEPAGVRFRKLLEALGPTYVKLGQILSMRGDILPHGYVAALQQLQDRAPPMPLEVVKRQIERGLGLPVDELFSEFHETPLGTASIAQTHRATTKAGRAVVVKVQREGIEAVMRGDLDLLYLAAKVLEATIDEMELYAPSAVVVEFEKALVRELDFRCELDNLVRARSFLDPARHVTVPKPHADLSCKTVLTMDYFDGVPLRKLEPGSARAKKAVEELLHVACKQIAEDGFFHGDPHPGNILIDDDDQICLIDFGLAGTLSPEQREDILTLVLAAILNDVPTIARVLLRMGTPLQRVNMAEFKAEITRVRSTHLVHVKTLDDYDSQAMAQEFATAASKYRIKLASEYAVLTKASATVEGIIRTLAPDADMVGIARPYAEGVLKARYSPERLMAEVMSGATGLGSLVRGLPGQLDQVLHDVETGNLQIKPVTPALDDIAPMLHQLGSKVALSLFATSSTVGGAVLLVRDPLTFHKVPVLAVLALLVASIAWSSLWWWHWVGGGKKVRLSPLMRFFKR